MAGTQVTAEMLATVSTVRHLFATGDAKKMREWTHLSVRELARLVGVSHTSLVRWEAGVNAPSLTGALAWSKPCRNLPAYVGSASTTCRRTRLSGDSS